MRLMFLTDSMIIKTKPSAYSKVAYNIFQGLKDTHSIAHTPMLQENNLGIFSYQGLLVYPSGKTDFAEDVIESNYYHFNADALLTLKDIPAFNQLNVMSIEWIPYTPIDGLPVRVSLTERLKYAFKVVSMSQFGYNELKKAGIDSTLIPHGVPDIYKTPEERGTTKQACRHMFHIKDDEDFIIGFIGMNRIRKNIPRIFELLKAVRDTNPDVNVKALVWTDIEYEVPLKPLILQWGLNEHIHWPEPSTYKAGLPEPLMPNLYGAFDICVCSSGEGFWMPGLEAMACGVPIGAPDYAAAADRVAPGCGYKFRVSDLFYSNVVAEGIPMIDLEHAARQITKLINGNPEKIKKRCVREANKYRWDKINEKYWKPFLAQCEEELLPMIKQGQTTKWDQVIG